MPTPKHRARATRPAARANKSRTTPQRSATARPPKKPARKKPALPAVNAAPPRSAGAVPLNEAPPRSAGAVPLVESAPKQVPCLSCGLCCSYVCVDIDGPNTLRGATTMLWYIYHEQVSVYTDGVDWMVQFDTRCRHLQEDNRCRIYETRPQICREFDETECEVNADDVGTTFTNAPDLLAYLAQHHKRIYNLLAKRCEPSQELLHAPPAMRGRVGPFAPRLTAVRRLRVLQ